MRSSIKKRFFQNFVRGPHAVVQQSQPTCFSPMQLGNSIFRTGPQIVKASHWTTNNVLAHVYLFMWFTSIFILDHLSIFSLLSYFSYRIYFRNSKSTKMFRIKKKQIWENVQNSKMLLLFWKIFGTWIFSPFLKTFIVFQNCSRFQKRKWHFKNAPNSKKISVMWNFHNSK